MRTRSWLFCLASGFLSFQGQAASLLRQLGSTVSTWGEKLSVVEISLERPSDGLRLVEAEGVRTQPFFSQHWTRLLLLLGASVDIAGLHLGEMEKCVQRCSLCAVVRMLRWL